MVVGVGQALRQRGTRAIEQGFQFLVAGLKRSLTEGERKDVYVQRSVELSVCADFYLKRGELGRVGFSHPGKEDGKQKGQPAKGRPPVEVLMFHRSGLILLKSCLTSSWVSAPRRMVKFRTSPWK